MENYFNQLAALPLRERIERKGNLDYISWANAWSMLKSVHPTAQRTVYESEHTGLNYFTDGKTCYVKVGIKVNDLEHIDYLPIMDFRNNAIPVDKVTSMDVNKAIQRSTAKAIAMHGLGLAMWTGEDIPETPVVQEPAVREELTKNGEAWKKVSEYVKANKELGMEKIVQQLSRKYIISAPIQKDIEKLVRP